MRNEKKTIGDKQGLHNSASPPAEALEPQPLEELLRYLTGFQRSDQQLASLSPAEHIAATDRIRTCLDWRGYRMLHEEIIESIEFILLPIALPGALHIALASANPKASLPSLVMHMGRSTAFDGFKIVTLDPYSTELAPALRHDVYSFELPSRQTFPLLLQRERSDSGYAPQYVIDVALFSPRLDDFASIPIIVHSCGSHRDLIGRRSFIHEFIHILQRVLRKQRGAAYVYREGDESKVRNPEIYVHVGIEDELEVQKIMVAAGYPFTLKPILHHKNNLATAFGDLCCDPVRKIVRAGIECIPFEKYDGLYDGDLREKILGEFCEIA